MKVDMESGTKLAPGNVDCKGTMEGEAELQEGIDDPTTELTGSSLSASLRVRDQLTLPNGGGVATDTEHAETALVEAPTAANNFILGMSTNIQHVHASPVRIGDGFLTQQTVENSGGLVSSGRQGELSEIAVTSAKAIDQQCDDSSMSSNGYSTKDIGALFTGSCEELTQHLGTWPADRDSVVTEKAEYKNTSTFNPNTIVYHAIHGAGNENNSTFLPDQGVSRVTSTPVHGAKQDYLHEITQSGHGYEQMTIDEEPANKNDNFGDSLIHHKSHDLLSMNEDTGSISSFQESMHNIGDGENDNSTDTNVNAHYTTQEYLEHHNGDIDSQGSMLNDNSENSDLFQSLCDSAAASMPMDDFSALGLFSSIASQAEAMPTNEQEEIPRMLKCRATKSENEVCKREPLSYDLEQGYRILKQIMAEGNKSLTWPFLNPVNADSEGCTDYYEVVKNPIWLKLMKEKFDTREYTNITEFVADMRLMLENCYRFNGPDHAISKKGQRLETMMEQKLALLSRELREKTSIAATSGEPVDNTQISGTRRRKAIVPHDSTALLNQLRLQAQEREKEERRNVILERKQAQEAFMQSLQDWEDTLLDSTHREQMRAMWQIPQIGHFLFLCSVPLNIGEVMQWELERCFMMPRESSTMASVMTALLSTPYQRTRLDKKPMMPYKVWEDKLRTRLQHWYKVFQDTGRDVQKTCFKLGLESQFFEVLGPTNPIRKKKKVPTATLR